MSDSDNNSDRNTSKSSAWDPWPILDTFFRDNANFITQHHLQSYDEFVKEKIAYTIKSMNPTFKMIKYDETQTRKALELRVFVGGKSADKVRIPYPTVPDPVAGKDRRLFPNEARLKSLDYKTDLFADITVETTDYAADGTESTRETTFPDIKIGAVPVMIGSCMCSTHGVPRENFKDVGECKFDQGGYFIISGKEKVIIAQERIASNRLFVTPTDAGDRVYSHIGMIRCTTEEAAVFPKTIYFKVAYPTSEKSEETGVPSLDQMKRRNRIVVKLPNLKEEVPLFVLFRAMGVTSDRMILSLILQDLKDPANRPYMDFLYASVIHHPDGITVYSQREALAYLGTIMDTTNLTFVKYMLFHDLFPNLNPVSNTDEQHANLSKKCMFLGQLTKKLVRVAMGDEGASDRDHYGYKRVDVSGFLCANLFRDFYNRFRRNCLDVIDRAWLAKAWGDDSQRIVQENNLKEVFASMFVEEGMLNSLRGRWGADEDTNGIAQELSRLSYMGFLSHLRRVRTPMSAELKVVAPRRLHSTQWGAMCPSESPDGGNIGLIKHLALLCHITPDVSSREIIKALSESESVTFLEKVSLIRRADGGAGESEVDIYVNNNWVGYTEDPDALVKALRKLRRTGKIHIMTSVVWLVSAGIIEIYTDAGRCARPLLIVGEDKRLVMSDAVMQGLKRGTVKWQELLMETGDRKACIEMVDVSESSGCLVAMRAEDLAAYPMKRYTHCEIHPSTILAVLIANIPFAEYNQAPRNYFSGAQGKQAVGVYNSQFVNRLDTTGLILHYPEKAIVNTRYMQYLNNNELPNGQNLIVAIQCYSGYNQEDSMILNRAAIQRGMFSMTYFKSLLEEEEYSLTTDDRIVFANPEKYHNEGKAVEGFGERFGNYSYLDEHGFPKLNSRIKLDDVYLGRVGITAASDKGDVVYSDKSAIANKIKAFTVDKVFVYQDASFVKQCKIRGRVPRMPTLGDKLASRHAQKGVIGMIMEPSDMPFTRDGLVPDLIINPHALPSRMTVGHLLECLFGKLGCLSGTCMDATPFCARDMDAARDALESFGFDRNGDEVLYSGITGQQMKCNIFIGPTYMLRLKHMVDEKVNWRGQDEAPYEMLTRQPVASRGNEGGLRVGEMEVGVLTAHGISSFAKESMFNRSDRYAVGIDKPIGDFAVMDVRSGSGTSRGIDPIADEGVNDNAFGTVAMPYASKLFLQELNALSLRTHIYTGSLQDPIAEDDDGDRGGGVEDDAPPDEDAGDDDIVGEEGEESTF
jgi:DNA-directed RNA polymerase II subunit RPB2